MVSRRTILQMGMVICLLVQAFLLSGPAQADNHAHATQTPIIDSIRGPRLVIQALAQRPIESDSYNVVSVDTRQGKLYLYFDHKQRKLQIYGDGLPTVAIDYPSELMEDRSSYNDVYYNERKNVAVYCPTYAKGIFVIDLTRKRFQRVDAGDCPRNTYSGWPDTNWSPDGRYFAYETPQREQRFYDTETQRILTVNEIASLTKSWLSDWSPRWDYQVMLEAILPSTNLGKCPPGPKSAGEHLTRFSVILRQRQTKTEKILLCLGWESIGYRWLSTDRLWLEGFERPDGAPKIYEVFVATISTGKVINLGLNIKGDGDFFDNDAKFARIHPLDSTDTLEPTWCVLNIIDLETLATRDIETTACPQPTDIHVLERYGKIIYVRSDITQVPLGDWQHQALSPYLRAVNLKTLNITTLAARNARQILSSSPDERFLALLASAQTPPRTIYYMYLWPQSRLLIYDIRLDKVIYEYELAKNIFFDDVDWSPNGSAFVFSHDGSRTYLSLVTLSEHPQTTSLTGSFSGNTAWSPDGQYFLFYRPDGIRVVRAKDQKILIVTKALETDAFVLDARWYGGYNHLLLIEAIPRQRSEPHFTSGRWVVDPARATE
jgi:Tol biopolymer transport system component